MENKNLNLVDILKDCPKDISCIQQFMEKLNLKKS